MRVVITTFALFLASNACAAPVPRLTDDEKLKSEWGKVVDGVGDRKAKLVKNQLVLSSPGGLYNFDMDCDGDFLPLRVEREADGDFEVEVKMVRTTQPSHMSARIKDNRASILNGLFLNNSKATVAFGRLLTAASDQGKDYFDQGLFQHFEGGRRVTETKPDEGVHIRLTRRGGKVNFAYSADGKKWEKAEGYEVELPGPVTVGVYLWHTVDQPCEAVFEHFKLTPLKKEK